MCFCQFSFYKIDNRGPEYIIVYKIEFFCLVLKIEKVSI